MKYKLEMYGWSVEAMGHSLNDSQVKSIQDLMESNGYSELCEVRNDLEEVGVIDDIYSPDLFHESRGLANDDRRPMVESNLRIGPCLLTFEIRIACSISPALHACNVTL